MNCTRFAVNVLQQITVESIKFTALINFRSGAIKIKLLLFYVDYSKIRQDKRSTMLF